MTNPAIPPGTLGSPFGPGWRTVALAAQPAQPWKNGGGQTRELLCWPDPVDWRLRLSVATIEQAGPFSSFPGVQRSFAVLEGDGVVLTFGATAVELPPHSPPLPFAGDEPVHCTPIAGRTLDFNLMLRGVQGELQRLPAGRRTIHCRAGEWHGFYSHDPAGTVSLPSRTLLWRQLPCDAVITLEAPQALWIKADPGLTRQRAPHR